MQEDLFENDFLRSNSLSDCEVGKGYPYKLHENLNVLKTFERATLEDCKESCRRMGNSFFSSNYCSYFVHGVSFSTEREYGQRATFINHHLILRITKFVIKNWHTLGFKLLLDFVKEANVLFMTPDIVKPIQDGL